MQIFHLAFKNDANKLSMARLGLRGIQQEYGSKLPNLVLDLESDDLVKDELSLDRETKVYSF
ncbi:MAG: hypothetical protein AAGF59_05315 [Pseudomonadota bacterium]